MSEPVDPEAPWGRRADGTPYKRDPGPFAHLRGKPFGTKSSEAKSQDRAKIGNPPKQRKPKDNTPPSRTAGEYARLIAKGVTGVGMSVETRGERGAGVGMVLKLQADQLGDAWGVMAVKHPRLGRTIDKAVDLDDTGRAIATVGQTFAMVARASGMIPDGHPLAKIIDGMVVSAVERYAEAHPEEFARMKTKAEEGDHGGSSLANLPVASAA